MLIGNVTRAGILNEHQRPTIAEVRWQGGKMEQVDLFAPNILVIVGDGEIPPLEDFAKKQGLRVARIPGRGGWLYRLVTADYSDLFVKIVEETTCDLRFSLEDGKLVAQEGKPNLENSYTVLVGPKEEISRDTVEEVAEWQNYF